MRIKELLEKLSEFSPMLLCGDVNWEVERVADDWLPIYDEGAVYVEDFVRCPAVRNSATVIVSDGALGFLSSMVVNVIVVTAADLESIKEKVSVLLN